MTINLLAVVLCSLLFLSCDGLEEGYDVFTPGRFVLESEYDLGEIRNTKHFYFELSNAGDSKIFGVTLSSSNTLFKLDAEHISEIKPLKEQSFFAPVRITAIHGTSESGLGIAEVMPPGLNQTRLTIRGRTTNSFGDTLRITENVVLKVNAFVVDIEVYDVSEQVILESPSGSASAPDERAFIRSYSISPGPIRIKNICNIDLSIRTYKLILTPGIDYEEEDVLLRVDEEVEIDREAQFTALRIDGNNTIADSKRLRVERNGMIYLAFRSD